MNKKTKKFVLDRETIKILDLVDVAVVQGGGLCSTAVSGTCTRNCTVTK